MPFNTSNTSLIHEIEDAIASGSSERRTQLLRSVTDLFLVGDGSLSNDQIALFEEIIGQFVEHIEVEARAELARRSAPLYRGPPAVIKALASDDVIDVAAQVLALSPQLQDVDLLHAARTKSQGHLLAISTRAPLSEIVTDVLVTRGGRQVVRSVARNEGARFSKTFGKLVTRSEDDDVLAMCVGVQKDIPPHQLKKLIGAASKIVRAKLVAENPHANDIVQTSVTRIAGDITAKIEHPQRDYIGAKKRMIEALFSTGKLDENKLQVVAKEGKFEDVVAAISILSSMSINTAEMLLLHGQVDTILILAKASDLSWATAKSLLMMRPGDYGISNADLDTAFESFKRLQVLTAQRILRFYRVRRAAGVQPN